MEMTLESAAEDGQTARAVRLLFVDDEPAVARALERLVRRSCPEWATEVVGSGSEALEKLAHGHFDAIVTDLNMPGMDGATLLNEVQQRHPELVRIVLSGGTPDTITLRSVPVAHQFLAKPFGAEELKRTLAIALRLHQRLSNPMLRQLVAKSNRLPPTPRVYAQLRAKLARHDVALSEVAGVIEQDPIVAAQLLRVATSALFGLPAHVGTVRAAVSYLGLQTVEALVLSAELFTEFDPRGKVPGASLDELQRHGVVTAQLARALLTGSALADTAFLAGMLHDMGVIVLAARAPKAMAEIGRLIEAGLSRSEAERNVLHCDHAEVGSYLLALWGMQQSLVEAVANHHLPPQAEPQDRLGAALAVANSLAHDPETELTHVDLVATGLAERIETTRSLARALKQR